MSFSVSHPSFRGSKGRGRAGRGVFEKLGYTNLIDRSIDQSNQTITKIFGSASGTGAKCRRSLARAPQKETDGSEQGERNEEEEEEPKPDKLIKERAAR